MKHPEKPQQIPMPATTEELQAIFAELGLPQSDPESMALLQSLIRNSGMSMTELFELMLPALEEAGNITDIDCPLDHERDA